MYHYMEKSLQEIYKQYIQKACTTKITGSKNATIDVYNLALPNVIKTILPEKEWILNTHLIQVTINRYSNRLYKLYVYFDGTMQTGFTFSNKDEIDMNMYHIFRQLPGFNAVLIDENNNAV